MARTRQLTRKSTSSKFLRKQLDTKAAKISAPSLVSRSPINSGWGLSRCERPKVLEKHQAFENETRILEPREGDGSRFKTNAGLELRRRNVSGGERGVLDQAVRGHKSMRDPCKEGHYHATYIKLARVIRGQRA